MNQSNGWCLLGKHLLLINYLSHIATPAHFDQIRTKFRIVFFANKRSLAKKPDFSFSPKSPYSTYPEPESTLSGMLTHSQSENIRLPLSPKNSTEVIDLFDIKKLVPILYSNVVNQNNVGSLPADHESKRRCENGRSEPLALGATFQFENKNASKLHIHQQGDTQ